MSEMTKYEEPATTVDVHQSVTQSQIRQTALELQDAHTIATAICQSRFVPDHLRGKAEETAVAILYGATVGFDPITAVQQIFAIGGKPALYARAMVAIVMKAGHEIWTEEERPGLVTVAGRRAGSEHITRVTWTSELAAQAGYDKNPKYKTDPRSMLYARASGDVARRIAPDALLGLAYNVEEMQLVDGEVQRPAVQRATSTAKDRVRAAIAAPPETSGSDEPAAVTASQAADDDTPPSEPETGELLSSAQSKKMHATFNELGLTDRDERLAYTSKVVGRTVESSNDLTKREAIMVIDALDAEIEMKAAGVETPPDAPDPVLDDLRDEILKTAEVKGRSLWDVETAFSNLNPGVRFYDGDAEQLATFHAWVKKLKKAA